MRTKFFLVIYLLMCAQLQAQDIPFSKVIHYNTTTVFHGMSITASADSGWLMVGTAGELLKINEEGIVSHAEKLICDFTGYAEDLDLRDIIATSDSGYLAVGTARNNNLERTEGIIIKITKRGYIGWSRVLYDEDNVIPMHLSEAIDSGYVITGKLTDRAYLNTPRNDVFFCKVTSEGELEWFNKGYYGKLTNIGSSIKAADNGYLATGYYTDTDASWRTYSYVLKLDKDGELQWAKHYVPPGNEYNYSMAEDVLVNTSGGLVYLQANGHVFIVAIDPTGKIIDHLRYKWMPARSEFGDLIPFNHINRTSDGGTVFTYGDQLSFGGVVKADSVGNKLFLKELVMVPVEAIENRSGSFMVFGKGPIYFAKKFNDYHHITGIIQLDSSGNGIDCVNDYTSWNPDKDTLIAKPLNFVLTSAGAIESSYVRTSDLPGMTSTDGCIFVSGSTEEQPSQPAIKVYPVPARGPITVELMKEEPGTFCLYNCLGTLLKKLQIDRKTTEVDLNDIQPGVCIFRFENENGMVVTGKIIRMAD